MERAILHSDLNCFYASVEMMLDPRLRGKAVAVCGCTEDRHGIVLAKSEKAKRAGVKTGMVNWEAQRCCKDLIIVPPQYDQYLKYSKLTQAIYQRYTDMVEPFGMDECWLDVTGSRAVCGDAMNIAEQIRRSVREELGLTVSIGVSFNKVFAKLGSDMKKPDAITEISSNAFREKVWPLPCSDMIYCGPATTAKLARYGVRSIGDVAACDPVFLKGLLGVNGLGLWSYANGRDNSRVMHKDFVSPIKSVGHGITCISDLENEDEVRKVILALSQDIGHKLRVHGLSTRTVQIHVRGNDLFRGNRCRRFPLLSGAIYLEHKGSSGDRPRYRAFPEERCGAGFAVRQRAAAHSQGKGTGCRGGDTGSFRQSRRHLCISAWRLKNARRRTR